RYGPESDRPRLVAGLGQLLFEELGGIRLGVELRLKVESGRMAEIAVRRPGIAIDAAMLAAAIGIDRAIKADVGAVVPCDDAARRLDAHLGFERIQLGQALPAVVEVLSLIRLVAPGSIGPRAAAAAPPFVDERTGRKMAAAAGCV